MYHCAQLDCWFGPCVLVGGFNLIISIPDPERILSLIEQHRINSFFAPIGLPDPLWVEAVTAVIVVKSGAKLSEAEVMSHCAQTLGSHKRPKRVFFTDALPRSASGKVMKRELRVRYAQAAEA